MTASPRQVQGKHSNAWQGILLMANGAREKTSELGSHYGGKSKAARGLETRKHGRCKADFTAPIDASSSDQGCVSVTGICCTS